MYQSALTTDERREEAFIKACGENGAATVVDNLLDQWFPFLLEPQVKDLLRGDLIRVLTHNLTTLEVAQAASLAVQGPTLKEWLDR